MGGQKCIRITQDAATGAHCIQVAQDKIRPETFGLKPGVFPEQMSDCQLRNNVHDPFSYWIICKFIVCANTPLTLKIRIQKLRLLVPEDDSMALRNVCNTPDDNVQI